MKLKILSAICTGTSMMLLGSWLTELDFRVALGLVAAALGYALWNMENEDGHDEQDPPSPDRFG